ncbi:MAG: hypothetical protein JST86_01830 [Bacteroidetes bacterium]|nr:hypothetical protein [Bacteroidota bacterium]
MTRFYFTACLCVFVCSSYAQIKATKEILQKIPPIKNANAFLNARAAFELYKKTTKTPDTAALIPAGNPAVCTFTWPQMKDGDNTLYFNGPIQYLSSEVIRLTSGSVILKIPNCQAAGFYLLQINGTFVYAGNTEIKVTNYIGVNEYPQPATAASMVVAALQPTTFVIGVNLVQGINGLLISLPNASEYNAWYFQSLKIQPLQ